MATTPTTPMCSFCPHDAHGTEKCEQCRCKGKRSWFKSFIDSIGNAIGEAKFGGN